MLAASGTFCQPLTLVYAAVKACCKSALRLASELPIARRGRCFWSEPVAESLWARSKLLAFINIVLWACLKMLTSIIESALCACTAARLYYHMLGKKGWDWGHAIGCSVDSAMYQVIPWSMLREEVSLPLGSLSSQDGHVRNRRGECFRL